MKYNFICLILMSFFLQNAHAQFRVGNVDYSKLIVDPEVSDGIDSDLLEILVPNEVSARNIENFVKRRYRHNNVPVIRNKTAPFIARVLSDYYDEATKKWRTVQGIGTLVNISLNDKEYTALLTVSHLTQGQRLRIFDIEGNPLTILPGSRLANIDDDVELILLKDQRKSLLKYSSELGIFRSTYYEISEGVVPDDYEVTDYDRIYVSKKQHVPIIKSSLPEKSNGQNFLANTSDREVVAERLLNLGLSREDFVRRLWDYDGILQKQLLGNGYIANARMPPGLSGAPLIRDIPESVILQLNYYAYTIEGLVQGHHRFENKSYFVGKESIRQLAQSFLGGKRNYTSQTRWRLRNGMTFRDFGNGVLETNIIKTPSGSFFKGESGNAISVDGDQGVEPVDLSIGMQNGYDSTVVGRFLKAQGKMIPVLADPRMEQQLPKDFEALQSFGADQDLLKLAKMKYEFRNKMANYMTNYDCFYKVTDKGIDVKVLKGAKVLAEWHRGQEQLKSGFKNNDLTVQQGSQKPELEVSGLFFTDMTSIPRSADPLIAGAPSITVAPFDGLDSEKVGCFESKQSKDQAAVDYQFDLKLKMRKVIEQQPK